jgi:hypothetical protein
VVQGALPGSAATRLSALGFERDATRRSVDIVPRITHCAPALPLARNAFTVLLAISQIETAPVPL